METFFDIQFAHFEISNFALFTFETRYFDQNLKCQNVMIFIPKKYRADFRVGMLQVAKPTLPGLYFVQAKS